MTVDVCDRCGDVTVAPDRCRCAAPRESVDVRLRHHHAVARARASEALAAGAPDARRIA